MVLVTGGPSIHPIDPTTLLDAEEHQRFADRIDPEPFTDEEMATFRTNKAFVLERFPNLDRRLGWAGDLPGLKKRTFEELEAVAGIDHLRPPAALWAANISGESNPIQ